MNAVIVMSLQPTIVFTYFQFRNEEVREISSRVSCHISLTGENTQWLRPTMHCTVDTTECLLDEKSVKQMMTLPLCSKRVTC